jgi:broad specificity phosphatase PhoE
MKVVSMRHSEAAAKTPGGDDASRILTTQGRTLAEKAGLGLRETGFVPKTLVVSPAMRARETASIVLNVLGLTTRQVEVEGLFKWGELLHAADEIGVVQELAHYKVKFEKDLIAFEEARMADFRKALVEHEVDMSNDILIVSHGWVAQAVIMSLVESQREAVRSVGLGLACSLVLENETLKVLNP